MSEDTPKAGSKAALEARIAELEAQLAEKPDQPTVSSEEGAQGEPITFINKKRKGFIRFPFRPQQTVIQHVPGGVKSHILRHAKPGAQFVPSGPVGLYTTTDLEEQKFLLDLCDPNSRRRNRFLSVLSV